MKRKFSKIILIKGFRNVFKFLYKFSKLVQIFAKILKIYFIFVKLFNLIIFKLILINLNKILKLFYLYYIH